MDDASPAGGQIGTTSIAVTCPDALLSWHTTGRRGSSERYSSYSEFRGAEQEREPPVSMAISCRTEAGL